MYVALLRGINVSGQKKIKMIDLTSLLEEIGLSEIQTYIQSGNVIFETNRYKKEEISTVISHEIKKRYGFDVPVLVLDIEELKRIRNANPFQYEEEDLGKKVYVTFLEKKVAAAEETVLRSVAREEEKIVAGERVVYLYIPNGYGKTKLNNAFFEKKLMCNATTRNLRTVEKLIALGNNV
ncbi:DUF1697 domain-containing protein [Aquimarina hainanensis]|uniref:DUF1697 domain-containing protein n=1 Tax=Aquimarina hainanensis TaxID=1578017 RepID=A0ABW5N3K2_9FLAO